MKPFKVSENVYQVGGPGMTGANDCCVYLVDGGGALMLVDAGCDPGAQAIVVNIIRLGLEPDAVASILLTHCHIDHVGGAAALRESCGAELIAHRLDAVPLEEGDRLMTAAFLYDVSFGPLTIDRKLGDADEKIEAGALTVNTVFTPGHSPGSVCAYVDTPAARVLFGQDIHGPFHPDFGSDINLWRDSMESLLSLEADILCEGHFGIYSPADAVRRYINSYLDRYAR